MSGRPYVLEREQLISRLHRFASLRGARRSLEPSVRSPEDFADDELTGELRVRLRELKDRFNQRAEARQRPGRAEVEQDAADLQTVDTALHELAELLRGMADGISMRQFRAVLPGLVREQRNEVLGLLDLCAAEAPDFARRVSLVDYLITLLCSEERDGIWTVVEDASNLSDEIRRRCDGCVQQHGSCEDELVERFRTASDRLKTSSDVGEVIREVAAFKATLGERFFLPEVMRVILHYNVFCRNLREAARRRQRALDQEIERGVEVTGPAADVTESVRRISDAFRTAETEAHSALESPGLLAIEEAIYERLSDSDTAPGPAATIAARSESSPLKSWEVAAFTAPTGEEVERLLRCCVAIGLAAEDDPENQAALAELGIEPTRLRRDWAREIGNQIQKQVNRLIAIDGFETACQLSETRNRVLYAPLSATARAQLHATPETKLAPSASRAAPTPARAAPARRRPGKGDAARGRSRSARRPKGTRSSAILRRMLAAVACAGIAGVAALHWLPSDPTSVGVLSEFQLNQISPLLLSGYRSELGEGDAFIGTLDAEWQQLGAVERWDAATEIQTGLARAGVREFMLFDSRRLLQARSAGGDLMLEPAPGG